MSGTKHLCQSCQTKFYNSNDNEITCPACGIAVSEIVMNIKGKDSVDISNDDYNEETENTNQLYIMNEDY